MRRAWSDAAEAKLRTLYASTPLPELARRLGRTQKAVRTRAKLLGLRKLNGSRRWTAEQDDVLTRRYPHERTADVAHAVGRAVTAVYQRAERLGLKKTAAYLASPASGRTTGRQGLGSRFQPGHATWNKGTRYVAGGRSLETRFKPGRPAHEARNYVPIGTLRISKDGYLERKVTDDPALLPVRRWVGVHRLVWEAAHGPVPAGFVVCFRPGRQTAVEAHITPEAVELVSRVDLMRRNTLHNYPEPIAKLIQLRGALNRKINAKAKRA